MRITPERALLCACLLAGAFAAPKVTRLAFLRLSGTVVRDETHGR
ncbi:hypothetical protein [Streptomyces radicis]|nr:hypothetical protein [Streptomyces radicis]